MLPSSNNWQFDAFSLSEATGGRALSCLAYFLINEAGLVKQFALRPPTLVRCGANHVGLALTCMLQQHTTTTQLLFDSCFLLRIVFARMHVCCSNTQPRRSCYLTFVSSSELFLLACMYVAATHNHNTAAI